MKIMIFDIVNENNDNGNEDHDYDDDGDDDGFLLGNILQLCLPLFGEVRKLSTSHFVRLQI